MNAFEQLLCDVAGGMGIPDAATEALAFLRCTGMSSVQAGVCSDVAPGALPIEISFSQANAAELRLLIEPCRPGEGILARSAMGTASIGSVAEIFSTELADRARELARHLLPDSEKAAHLNWRSSVWLALRTNGEQSSVRVYVNGQFGDAWDRWRRMERAFAACGLEQSKIALDRVRRAVGDLVKPIGLCFDVRSSGVEPARVHGVTERISPFWLLQLLAATGHEYAAADVADFLDLFGLLERSAPCPILVSVGLEEEEAGSLKIDVDLPNLEPDLKGRRRADYLAKAEARFGEIAGYHSVRRMFDGADPRYIGITIRPASRILNVYFPGAPLERAGFPSTQQAHRNARAFVHQQLEKTGALMMDARSSGAARSVPDEWPDLYMTCLLVQEPSPVLCLGCEALDRARSYVKAAREDWAWRYLPDLPPDLDDTAMAWAALGDCEIDPDIACRIMALANPDGGFRTFIGEGGEGQPLHPAVTLNVAFAFDRARIAWPRAATDQYLAQWLRRRDFPACEWMGSPVFPIYLFARTQAAGRLDVADRLAGRVMELRRADGTWGGELPDSFDTALAVVTLDRLGVRISGGTRLEQFFLKTQFDDGGWGWSPLYSDGSGTWFGHRAITTAFVVRAMEILGREGA